METPYRHRILVADDEVVIGKAIHHTLKPLNVDMVFVKEGDAALEKLKTSVTPFSLVISDHQMPGMLGTELLEQAKQVAPDTVRFLITGYSNMDTIINAVNRGSVHRYIQKPWDMAAFLETVQQGLAIYEAFLENRRLFDLAKTQNAKLYALNRELVDAAREDAQQLRELDDEISRMDGNPGEPDLSRAGIMAEMEEFANAGPEPPGELLNRLYGVVMDRLWEDVNDLAMRNGFDLPEPEEDEPR